MLPRLAILWVMLGGSVFAKEFSQADREWWAFLPVTKPAVPTVGTNWALNELDHFVARKLETQNLSPAKEADRRTLIRRLSFDLTGLPPSPEQIAEFLADRSPDAYEKLVDRLLDSPHYGERLATFWLDLVRYADSDGYRADHYRPDAWRYRDYVIRSFNQDKPLNRLIQIRVTVLPHPPHLGHDVCVDVTLRHQLALCPPHTELIERDLPAAVLIHLRKD